MNISRWFFVNAVLFMALASPELHACDQGTVLCGVDRNPPSPRIFVRVDERSAWSEYPTRQSVPAPQNDSGESALLWSARDGESLVKMEEPGEDFFICSTYCFSKSGALATVDFELRTAWGWGYRTSGPVTAGALASKVSEFFDTHTGHVLPRPQEADGIAVALKPRLYLDRSELPFLQSPLP